MLQSPILRFTNSQQKELFDHLNYLNMDEIKQFCKRQSIPYRIVFKTEDGRTKFTSDFDRKGVVLGRIRHFLITGEILPETCFQPTVVCFDPLPKIPTANDRLHYGQYDKANRPIIALLKHLTGGQFKNGAIARIAARDFWSKGKAPTFKEYASAWLRASREHQAPNPEWAFLSDKANKSVGTDWKKLRSDKAAKVMKMLQQIMAPQDKK